MADIGSVGHTTGDPYGSGHYVPLKRQKTPASQDDEGKKEAGGEPPAFKGAGSVAQRLREIAERMLAIQSAIVTGQESGREELMKRLSSEQVAMENLLSMGPGPTSPEQAMDLVKDIAGFGLAPHPQSVNRLLGG
ncbi:MAG: hypothetical protein AB7F75_10110 [Planctomycetota bacterium]